MVAALGECVSCDVVLCTDDGAVSGMRAIPAEARLVASFGRNVGRLYRLRRLVALFDTDRLPSGEAYRSSSLRRWVAKHAPDYDAVLLDSFNLCWLLDSIPSSLPVVLMPYDAYSLGSLRAVISGRKFRRRVSAWVRWRQYRRFERDVYPRVRAVCPVSSLDLVWLEAYAGVRVGRVFPISIDVDVFVESSRSTQRDVGFLPRLAIIGDAWIPEVFDDMVDAARVCDEELNSRDAEIIVWSVGAVEELRAVLPSRVRVVGRVPDYAKGVCGIDVCVYPQKVAAGLQTKLQAQLASGCVCIGTTAVLHPLGVRHGESGIFADSEATLRASLRWVWENPKEWGRIGMEARELMVRRFDGGDLATAVSDLFSSVVSGAEK